jgi:hypothetical protein
MITGLHVWLGLVAAECENWIFELSPSPSSTILPMVTVRLLAV